MSQEIEIPPEVARRHLDPDLIPIVHSAMGAAALVGKQREQAAYLRRFGWKETMDGWIDPNIGGSRTRMQAVTYQAKLHVEAAVHLLNPQAVESE